MREEERKEKEKKGCHRKRKKNRGGKRGETQRGGKNEGDRSPFKVE